MMWPLLLTSLTAMTVIIERAIFLTREAIHRNPGALDELLAAIESGNLLAARKAGEGTPDFIARTLLHALGHGTYFQPATLLAAANRELHRYNRGISLLDTIITLAPLEGLFGTVTGMIRAFGMLGGSELGAPSAITGGIAEALIATAFGLLIAMMSLLPFNYLNYRLERARAELEDASAQFSVALQKSRTPAEAAA